jgi:regulatory protein
VLRKRYSVNSSGSKHAGFDPDGSSHTAPDEKTVRATAVRLLARREHSTQELRRKLTARHYPAGTVDAVIGQLAAKRLVSDERFISSFVHHHAMRGQGPIRIRAELRQQGVADAAIEAEFERGGFDWPQLATQTLKRKFGTARPKNLPERAKRMRFLQYRGFSTDQIRAALASVPTTESWDEAPDPVAEPGIDSDLDL